MARKKKEDITVKTTEKPKKKKWWIIIVVLLVIIIALFGCGGNSEDTTNTANSEENVSVEEETTQEEETTTQEEQQDAEETTTDTKALKNELKDKYTLKGGSSVRNDVTDSWVIEAINSGAANDPTVWAYDYVQAYWEDGIKVMWVVNFANNTTTSINTSDGSMLFVTQHEYVDKEEHDAKILGEGTVLGDWVIYHDDNGELVCESTME